MGYWAIRIGIALVILGATLLSPFSDLIPVDLWPSLRSLFLPSSLASHPFRRVVPSEQNRIVEFVLISLGLFFLVLGFYLRPRK